MGHAVADVAARRGAAVTLVTTTDRPTAPAVDVVRVDTAEEMADAVLGRFPEVDVVVMAAAVADFRPKATTDQKLKKHDGVPEVVLEPTPDILAALGERKQPHQLLIGFAAETERVQEQAAAKLAAKRVDLMVANDGRRRLRGRHQPGGPAVLVRFCRGPSPDAQGRVGRHDPRPGRRSAGE
jgi:phosphopantothenoylcysteine decarboxylase / phosphopantothenate---cysteine ligase